MTDDTKERKWAEAQFKKEERATEGAKAMSEYKAERDIDPARRCQPLPRRADIRVSDLVVTKVLAREGAVVALGPLMDWDVAILRAAR